MPLISFEVFLVFFSTRKYLLDKEVEYVLRGIFELVSPLL